MTQSGLYYLIFKTDNYDQRYESDESNNVLAVPFTFNGPRPVIGIHFVGSQIELYWPTNATGFRLQSAVSVGSSPVWGAVTNTPATSGGSYRVTVNPSDASRFFRLINP